jgi:DNA-binding response OmpR family regulator
MEAEEDNGEVMGFLEKNRPDLIVLGVMLPGRDGFALMEAIAPMGIPVISLTAKDRLDDKISGLKLGADDYIVKPFAAAEALKAKYALRQETLDRFDTRAVFFSAYEDLTADFCALPKTSQKPHIFHVN